MKESGFVAVNNEVSGTNYYGACHQYDYVRDKLAAGYRILSFIPEGARGNPHQDVYLLQRVDGALH